jgi:hypothetical protein
MSDLSNRVTAYLTSLSPVELDSIVISSAVLADSLGTSTEAAVWQAVSSLGFGIMVERGITHFCTKDPCPRSAGHQGQLRNANR